MQRRFFHETSLDTTRPDADGGGLTGGAFLSRYQALAAPQLNRVKITNVRAMAIKNIAGNCLIRVDTDSGLTGYGEAGSTGPMARARIETMKPLLVGKDPLPSKSTSTT